MRGTQEGTRRKYGAAMIVEGAGCWPDAPAREVIGDEH
jgi:hypothetical protein